MYKKERKHNRYFARKLTLPFDKQKIINIYGAPKVGKTTFAKGCSIDFKKPFSIDCSDIRLEAHIADIAQSLPHFIANNPVDLLILDNVNNISYFEKSLITLQTYNNLTIILISNTPLLENAFHLRGLDFEEFIGFSHSNHSTEQLFNLFLLDGTLPEICLLDESKKGQRKREIIMLNEHATILKALLPFMGHSVTIHQLYTHLKKTQPISKDTLYKVTKKYTDEGIIMWLPQLNHHNAPKKLYFWDFSLFNAISYERNFVALFENMIFLELVKLNQAVLYSSSLDFLFLDKKGMIGIIAAPFLSQISIQKRIQKAYNAHRELRQIIIITLSSNFEHQEPIHCIALPFWEFALGGEW